MIFWFGFIMLLISVYMNYTNMVVVDPFYSFALQESLSIIGTALITRSWIFRKLRGNSRRRSR